jgi:2-polyprenyl-3-methyl-5-hydroxy-6-metoxy-1,4-benzoquinol methylase
MVGNCFVIRERCPGCNSSGAGTIYSRPFSDPQILHYLQKQHGSVRAFNFEQLAEASFVLAECSSCGLIFQQQIPDEKLMKEWYQESVDVEKSFEQFRRRQKLTKRWRCAGEIMMIISYMNKPPRKLKLLDFGMGWGGWCSMAKAFGCESYGIEFSQQRTEYAKANGIHVVEWDDLSGYSFDFINTEQVLEHIPNPRQTLQKLKQALSPNGILKISVPDCSDLKRRLKIADWTAPRGAKNSLYLISPLEHINGFTHDSIIKMAETLDLKPVKIPMRKQLIYTTNLSTPAEAVRSFLRPFYRNVLERGTYLFFKRQPEPSELR